MTNDHHGTHRRASLDDRDVLTTREAADVLGVTNQTLLAWNLPSFRVGNGRSRRYLKSTIDLIRAAGRPDATTCPTCLRPW